MLLMLVIFEVFPNLIDKETQDNDATNTSKIHDEIVLSR